MQKRMPNVEGSHRCFCEACTLKHGSLCINEEYHVIPAGEPLLQYSRLHVG